MELSWVGRYGCTIIILPILRMIQIQSLILSLIQILLIILILESLTSRLRSSPRPRDLGRVLNRPYQFFAFLSFGVGPKRELFVSSHVILPSEDLRRGSTSRYMTSSQADRYRPGGIASPNHLDHSHSQRNWLYSLSCDSIPSPDKDGDRLLRPGD